MCYKGLASSLAKDGVPGGAGLSSVFFASPFRERCGKYLQVGVQHPFWVILLPNSCLAAFFAFSDMVGPMDSGLDVCWALVRLKKHVAFSVDVSQNMFGIV